MQEHRDIDEACRKKQPISLELIDNTGNERCQHVDGYVDGCPDCEFFKELNKREDQPE